jgi:hypothetical protein
MITSSIWVNATGLGRASKRREVSRTLAPRGVLAALLTFGLGGFSAGCDPVYQVCIVVTACDTGEPIAEAHVTVLNYEFEGTTNSRGKACFGGMGEATEPVWATVDKPGYVTVDSALSDPHGESDVVAAVCLHPVMDDGSNDAPNH